MPPRRPDSRPVLHRARLVVPITQPAIEDGAVVVAEGTINPAELIALCRRSLSAQKVPKQIVIVDVLPRNASGKVVKAELAKRVPQ